MTATESGATTEGNSSDTATEEEPTESTEPVTDAVSWESTIPDRIRSFGVGGLLGVIGVTLLEAASWLPTLLGGSWLSVDLVLLVGVLVVVGGPFSLLYMKVADDEATDAERRSFRGQFQRPDWSSMYLIWVGCGAVASGVILRILDSPATAAYTIQMAVISVMLVFQLNFQEWTVTKTVDPTADIIETEGSDRTKRRSVEWAVGIRRFDLLGRSLFVFSNRGKRWYEGPHLLMVPVALAPEVDPLLRRMVDRNDSPPRINRDERIVIGVTGMSMIVVGPLLYLLSGEAALLLLIVGPSALVAHFALLHAVRG